MRNKANLPRTGSNGTGPARPGSKPRWYRVCETKPISPRRPGMGASQQGQASAPAGTNRAKQSQFHQSDMGDKCFMGKRLRQIRQAKGLCKTKPISGRGRPVGEATIPSCPHFAAAPGAQTKPIYLPTAADSAGRGNSAKQSQSARSDCRETSPGAAAKQSQFLPVRADPIDLEQAIAGRARQSAAVCRPAPFPGPMGTLRCDGMTRSSRIGAPAAFGDKRWT